MVFSALVDADHLDTGAHRTGLAGPQVAPSADMAELVGRFEQRRRASIDRQRQDGGFDEPTDVDLMRAEVYEAAVTAAGRAPAFFRLAAPTGLGKTFAQGAFGLHHAHRYGKSRVIVAVPYITITQQNAGVYQGLLDLDGRPVVLEHHSSVRFYEPDDGQPDKPSERWARMAAENWDAPFVVTTTVQLFESLFGRKPSQVRKLHRLANAVLVLDEVQALPTAMLLPILDGLRILVEHFGTTVLLTSATQPQFQSLSVWNGTLRSPVRIDEVIADPQPLFDRARRVRYEWRLDPQPTWQQVAEEVGGHRQVLVVVNSVADARGLYRLLESSGRSVWHLSTRLCPVHRREVLQDVTARLKRGEPVIVVSTQLIEAGVDLSFPVVWRALAPADSLQQAGGRANRNGELADGGLVVVFDPADGHAPPAYKTPTAFTAASFGPDRSELDDQEALGRYYRKLYQALGIDNRTANRQNEPAGQVVQRNREKFDYIAVTDGPEGDHGRDRTKAFRMIDDDTVPVVVVPDDEHRDEVESLLGQLAAGVVGAGRALRKLQPWTVQLPKYTAEKPEVAALIEPVVGDLGVWKGAYDWDWVEKTCRGRGLDEDDITTVF
jgi:CRISPR-associated endonuclease/helicase Cas3